MHAFRMYWRRSMQKPGTIVLWMLLPFVFMVIYTTIFGGDGPSLATGLAVLDRDSTFVANLVKGAFDQGPVGDMLEVYEVADMEEVEKLFDNGKASAALVIPKNFGEDLLALEEPRQPEAVIACLIAKCHLWHPT